MDQVKKTSKEVLSSLVPTFIIVIILNMTIGRTDLDTTIRFVLSSILVFIGLTIFIIGVNIFVGIIGSHMGRELSHGRSIIYVLFLGLSLGFLVTIAEPSANVFSKQIELASGGLLNSSFIIYVISFGFGIFLSLGVIRVLKEFKLRTIMAISYSIILVLGIIVRDEYFGLALDSGASSTGALTTPFILAIASGVSRAKGGRYEEENSFGMVGLSTVGPIIFILLAMIFVGSNEGPGNIDIFIGKNGIIMPILNELWVQFKNALMAISFVSILFYIYNLVKFKMDVNDNRKFFFGLIFTILGLTIFLGGINSGFMDMGMILGSKLAISFPILLPIVGAILGMIIVLAEPSVQILAQGVEDKTSGVISKNLLKITLSLGVGLSMVIGMVNILFEGFSIYYVIYPVYILIIILSFYIDDLFVGISYDAGAVASGPMTATFIVAFAQGAAKAFHSANILEDGFGVIALIAMIPILLVSILGAVFKLKREKEERIDIEGEKKALNQVPFSHGNLVVIVNRGDAGRVIDLARDHGARGATIINARRSDNPKLRFLNFQIQEEKDMVIFVMELQEASRISNILTNVLDIDGKSQSIYIVPALI